MMVRSQQTLTIEAMLKDGKTISSIARSVGVSRARVQQIKRRVCEQFVNSTEPVSAGGELVSSSPFKPLTISLTPAVHDALVAACEVANRNSPEETITIQEYVEECVINRVAELGLLRRNKK